ncbi:type II toxin-antitoxin system VapC family toxin [Oscillatoria salina]|uniref:type II toxin-antitoxin system VapC family toxin n=1 Tax=Oscillatoria salina TaxID=331517 RepID=UPI001CCA4852|nr:type II toxin-antitoxin system VapC family toxin [Oscillatoria salina]MBZ8181549.1 type II toxin-antitoxin system VapC family toxin [Oscillatoria salina IIICB1]
MDKLVVDSSVAIKWFIPQPYSSEAQKILNAYQSGSLLLLAPELIYAEVGNIVWKLSRFQGLSETDAVAILDGFCSINISVTPLASLLNDAYQLAVTHERSVYDSLYVVLSLRQNCQFVTADQKLVNAISGTFSNVIAIADW